MGLPERFAFGNLLFANDAQRPGCYSGADFGRASIGASRRSLLRITSRTCCVQTGPLQASPKEDRARDKKRQSAAEQYDGIDMRVEKHWSEKAREDMTDRDWRIFREDFNIAYKGSGATLPIRR